MSSISHHYIMSGMIYGFPFVQLSLCKSFVKTGSPLLTFSNLYTIMHITKWKISEKKLIKIF